MGSTEDDIVQQVESGIRTHKYNDTIEKIWDIEQHNSNIDWKAINNHLHTDMKNLLPGFNLQGVELVNGMAKCLTFYKDGELYYIDKDGHVESKCGEHTDRYVMQSDGNLTKLTKQSEIMPVAGSHLDQNRHPEDLQYSCWRDKTGKVWEINHPNGLTDEVNRDSDGTLRRIIRYQDGKPKSKIEFSGRTKDDQPLYTMYKCETDSKGFTQWVSDGTPPLTDLTVRASDNIEAKTQDGGFSLKWTPDGAFHKSDTLGRPVKLIDANGSTFDYTWKDNWQFKSYDGWLTPETIKITSSAGDIEFRRHSQTSTDYDVTVGGHPPTKSSIPIIGFVPGTPVVLDFSLPLYGQVSNLKIVGDGSLRYSIDNKIMMGTVQDWSCEHNYYANGSQDYWLIKTPPLGAVQDYGKEHKPPAFNTYMPTFAW